jgi:hypothetical protein
MAGETVELRKGALDVLILKAVSWGPAHGYGVSRWIRETTGGTLSVEEGALYPALHRMELKGWIESTWGLSDNRRLRYYESPLRQAHSRRSVELDAVALAMAKVLDGANPPEWARQARPRSRVATSGGSSVLTYWPTSTTACVSSPDAHGGLIDG